MAIYMNCVAIGRNLANISNYANRVGSLLLDVTSIQASLINSGRICLDDQYSLQRAISALKQEQSKLSKLASTAETAVQAYTACEMRICGATVKNMPPETSSTKKANIDWAPLLRVVGEFGTMGAITSSLLGVAEDPSTIGMSLSKLVGVGAKTAAKIADKELIDMWGTSTVNAIGFSENLASKLDSFIINNPYNSNNMSVAAKNAANISAVAKWSGIVISGLLNLGENFEEFHGDFSNPRLYAETIGETAAGVGLDILVGAGVATLAGAFAPVWAVGVVSTGVILGANWISEQLTGEDLPELISDAVWDGVECLGNTVSNAVKSVGNAVNAVTDCISTGWKELSGWLF